MADVVLSTPIPAEEQRGSSRRSMAVAAFGTIIEWYDFTLYLYVATILTKVFFGGNADDLLLTFGVFAASYLFRPVGAIVFGHLGDRIGRKQTLVISAGLMALAMLGVGLLPGKAQIGPSAGILLFLLRSLAGFSVGAEYTGILVFLLESAPARRRGFVASLASANSEIGALLAVGVATVLATALSPAALDSWGWRITFIVGAALAAAMIPLRSTMEETVVFKRCQEEEAVTKQGSPLPDVFRHQPLAVLLAFVISSVGSISYYLNIGYVPTFLSDVTHYSGANSLLLSTVAAAVVIVVTPFFGYLSDRGGRRWTMLVICAALVVTTVPFYALLLDNSAAVALGGTVILAIPAAAWSAVAAAAVPEQFAAVGRFSGMAIGYNIATALFGGLSPLVATLFLDGTHWSLAPAAYSGLVALIVFPVLFFLLKETAGKRLADRVG